MKLSIIDHQKKSLISEKRHVITREEEATKVTKSIATNIKRNKTICVFVKKLDSTTLYLASCGPEYVRYSSDEKVVILSN